MLGVTVAPAEAQFTGITDFGDSYADTGSAPGGAFRLAGPSAYSALSALGYPSCRFTGSTNFVDSLQAIYGLPTATNYAIGGARTDDTQHDLRLASTTASRTNCNQFAGNALHQ